MAAARFGYVIVYVADVDAAVAFHRAAFGFELRMRHESGQYSELATGETTLAFAGHELGAANFPGGYRAGDDGDAPLGAELAFVVDDVSHAVDAALAAGASLLRAAEEKPWGQTVAYVRGPEGSLIELCTPMAG
ncbi:MAG: VOC family protein [Phycisphaerales bacterium]